MIFQLPVARIGNGDRRATRLGRLTRANARQRVVETTVDIDRHRALTPYGRQELLQEPVFAGAVASAACFRRYAQSFGNVALSLFGEPMPLGGRVKERWLMFTLQPELACI